MTNKLNELKPLSNIENIYFYTNFNFLDKINDNYYLFCIENNITYSGALIYYTGVRVNGFTAHG